MLMFSLLILEVLDGHIGNLNTAAILQIPHHGSQVSTMQPKRVENEGKTTPTFNEALTFGRPGKWPLSLRPHTPSVPTCSHTHISGSPESHVTPLKVTWLSTKYIRQLTIVPQGRSGHSFPSWHGAAHGWEQNLRSWEQGCWHFWPSPWHSPEWQVRRHKWLSQGRDFPQGRPHETLVMWQGMNLRNWLAGNRQRKKWYIFTVT